MSVLKIILQKYSKQCPRTWCLSFSFGTRTVSALTPVLNGQKAQVFFSGMEMICDFQVEKHLWGKITYIKTDNALAEEKEELFTIKILKKCKFALPESYHLFIL